jgi:hypothetical protein
LLDSSTVGDAAYEGAEIDHIVDTSGSTIGTIATPETRGGIEPEAGRVVVVERTEANEGVHSGRGKSDARGVDLIEDRAGGFDTGNQPSPPLWPRGAFGGRVFEKGARLSAVPFA